MTYFSYFPIIPYEVDGNAARYRNARNILVRTKITNYLRDTAGISSSYFIADGERPDTLAYKIYGRADLHWLILLMNEIHDPYRDWALNSAQLEARISDLYPGIAVYLRDSTLLIDEGASVYLKGEDGSYARIGTVRRWDPTYLKLEVEGTEELTADNATVRIGEDGADIATFRSELNRTSIHHFEKDGFILASFGSVENPDVVGLPNQPERTPLIISYANGSSPEVAQMAVDNSTHEQTVNDGKREIRILKPQLIDDIFRLMREAFKTG